MTGDHAGSPWLVTRIPRSRPRVRLIAFPFAGGNAGVFDAWAPLLPPEIELCAVQYPGRHERSAEPAPRRMAQLLGDLERGLRGQLDRRYVLYGNSFGALVAYEFARRAQRRGLPGPARLLVSSAAAPHRMMPLPEHRGRSDAELTAELVALGTLPAEVAHHADLIAATLPTVRADFELAASYRPSPPADPLAVPIDAISGADDPFVGPAAVDGWAELTAAGFTVTWIPGGHDIAVHPAGGLAAAVAEKCLVSVPTPRRESSSPVSSGQ
ncbi:MAG: thioesterase II family protein [Frankia sp.]